MNSLHPYEASSLTQSSDFTLNLFQCRCDRRPCEASKPAEPLVLETGDVWLLGKKLKKTSRESKQTTCGGEDGAKEEQDEHVKRQQVDRKMARSLGER